MNRVRYQCAVLQYAGPPWDRFRGRVQHPVARLHCGSLSGRGSTTCWTGEPETLRGQALVDILGAWSKVGDTGQSMLELVRERAASRNTALDDRALVLCNAGWTSAADARAMPEVTDGLAIDAADWRRGAAFSVVSRTLDGRESGVRALVEGLGGSLTPTDTEWSRTVERVSKLVQSGEIDATWDGFLTSLLEVLPSKLAWKPTSHAEDALRSPRGSCPIRMGD